MNRLSTRFCRFLLLPAAIFLLPGTGWTQETEPPKKRDGEKGSPRAEMWGGLSPEQREALREALREAWTDPAVINAREEVKRSGDAYQAAIKAAVERVDPSLASLLEKMQGAGGPWPGRGPGHLEKPGGHGGGPERGFDPQILPPGFLDSLSSEEREKFRKAEEAALESEAVKAAHADLAKIREEDDALRRRRIEAHRKLRKTTLDEMARIDPSIAEIQKRLRGESRAKGKGERGGDDGQRKGKGKEKGKEKGKDGAPYGKKESEAPPAP